MLKWHFFQANASGGNTTFDPSLPHLLRGLLCSERVSLADKIERQNLHVLLIHLLFQHGQPAFIGGVILSAHLLPIEDLWPNAPASHDGHKRAAPRKWPQPRALDTLTSFALCVSCVVRLPVVTPTEPTDVKHMMTSFRYASDDFFYKSFIAS